MVGVAKAASQQAEILLYEAVSYSILMVNAAIRRLAKHWPNFNVLQRSLVRHPRPPLHTGTLGISTMNREITRRRSLRISKPRADFSS